MNFERVTHNLPPVYDERSRVLILGTMPSPKSRELGFYYMNPQNRFWRTVCAVLGVEIPTDIEGRTRLCLTHNIALWDVLASCDINGASDSSIVNPQPNDLRKIFAECDIRAVFTTGKKAHSLYNRFFADCIDDICLPSPSPANCAVSEAALLEKYRIISEY